MRFPASASLRFRFLALVLVAVVLPLAIAGWWVTRSAVEFQVDAMQARLEESLDRAVRKIHGRWIVTRSHLLDLGEDWTGGGVISADAADRESREERVREALSVRHRALSGAVQRLALEDREGNRLWEVHRSSFDPTTTGLEPAIRVRQVLYARSSGDQTGVIEAEVLMQSLLGQPQTSAEVTGLLLAVVDLESGASLLPLPFDPALLDAEERLSWGGSEWLVARRELSELPVRLVALAPLTPILAPLEMATRRGLWVLVGVSLLAFVLAGLLTRRMTRSLERLADAAAGVRRGELEFQVDVDGEDEVGRLGSAFNLMTENLRSTLRELSRRETLATVGELAASLSHEVRNILTSVRLDLQRVEETLPEDDPARETQRRALGEVARLDATVTTTLQMARGSSFDPEPVDLRGPIEAAGYAAMPEFDAKGADLLMPQVDRAVRVLGEEDALEQLLLNLLLNAAQAIAEGGRVEVRLEETGGCAVVSVVDDGEGMSAERQEKIFEPFYSTRQDGTGLGLAVVQRIVRLHEGSIAVDSTPGRGTKMSIELSLAKDDPTSSA